MRQQGLARKILWEREHVGSTNSDRVWKSSIHERRGQIHGSRRKMKIGHIL